MSLILKIKSLLLDNKTIKQTIIKNTFWLTFSEIISKSLRLLLVVYVARVLGVIEYGKFNFALRSVTILVILADLGMETIIVREFSKDPEKKKYFSAILTLKTLLSFVSLAAIIAFSYIATSDELVKRCIWTLGIYILINHFSDFFYAVFRSQQKMEYEAMGKIFSAIICTSCGFIFLAKTQSITQLSYAYLFGTILSLLIISIIYQNKFCRVRLHVDKKIWKIFLSMSLPLAMVNVFSLIYHFMDSVMLGLWGMMKENGLYNAAYNIMNVSIIPMVLVSSSFFPALSKSFVQKFKNKRQKKIFLSQLSISSAIAFLLVTTIFTLAPKIINIVYGEQYQAATQVLRILTITAGIMYITRPFLDLLIAEGLQKEISKISLLAAVLNITLNFILIPRYTLYGAATATLVTYLFLLVLCILLFKKNHQLNQKK